MPRSRYWRLAALLLLLACLLATWRWREHRSATAPPLEGAPGDAAIQAEARALLALEAREQGADRTVWAEELDAERHEDVFLNLWEALNRAPEPLAALAEFDFEELRLGPAAATRVLKHSIHQTAFSAGNAAGAERFTPSAWREKLAAWRAQGWRLGRTGWRETRFTPAAATRPARSVIEVSAQLVNQGRGIRAMIRGDLEVTWKSARAAGVPPAPATVATHRLELLTRTGPPLFTESFRADLIPPPDSAFVDPLLLSDLDGDGRSEIVLVGANTVFRRDGGTWRAEALAALPAAPVLAALLIDLTGDGRPDLLVASAEGLTLFENDGHGRFPGGGRLVWRAPVKLKHPQVITAGDIDGDGRIDLWLAQYKLPYQGGQFPTPYFDAADGFPAYLLRNDGHGGFSDITVAAGLGAKRCRRTYSASFVDLNGDGHLDLVNVSDFAGVDVFLGDGRGRFTDVTAGLGQARHLFGMSHALADLDGDGRVDLFVLGMDSPTASRLDALGLRRPGFPGYATARTAMTYGNRLFLGTPQGLRLAPFADQLAHAGWSWSVSLVDFDNDGDLDVAIANGHETRPGVQDYERQFWRHDLFVANSSNNPVAAAYFASAAARRLARQASYGGWQNNAFFLNLGGNAFAEAAFLLGVALPEDSQNLVSDDLDGDGRPDLIVTSFGSWPERRRRLRIFHNVTPDAGHWIGFRFDSAARPWVGARVRVETARGAQTRWLVTGDAYRSQHAATAHFGLGADREVSQAEVFWLDGSRTVLLAPAVDQWHAVAPAPSAPQVPAPRDR
ncbi:MAG: VCBS repeat-containing protein [Verrucomicrobia bacterium]|nr:VCBS repeat-containing protein [Verrucomicrobiota bacterium]